MGVHEGGVPAEAMMRSRLRSADPNWHPLDWQAVWALLEQVFKSQFLSLGAHMANAGYVVAEQCHSLGIGFHVVGTLPGAFQHRQLGYIDAFVMIKGLVV